MVPFIDFHTHQPHRSGVFSIRNASPHDSLLFSDSSPEFISVGLHPWLIPQDYNLDALYGQLYYFAGYSNVIAIGETGMDKAITTAMQMQLDVLEVHIRVSEALGKPIIVHCVRSYQELLALRVWHKCKQPWIFHGFNGSAQLAMQLLKAHCLVSFGKAIMQGNTRAAHSISQLEFGQFFLETDNSGENIEDIYGMCASIKKVEVDAVKEHIFALLKKTIPNLDL